MDSPGPGSRAGRVWTWDERRPFRVSKVYEKGDWVGSLVVPVPGDPRRPTAWDGASPPPSDVAWRDFPGLLERWWKHGEHGDGIGVR